jgi:hypothetical protein
MRSAEQIFIVEDLGVLLLEADQQLFSLALVTLQFRLLNNLYSIRWRLHRER